MELNEETPNENAPPPDLNKLLADWLAANNATLISRVLTPKGEAISVENFIPAGWRVVVVVARSKP
jgi:hypothetical protein